MGCGDGEGGPGEAAQPGRCSVTWGWGQGPHPESVRLEESKQEGARWVYVLGTVLAAGGRQLRPDAGTRQQTSELEAGGSFERDPWEHRAGTGWGVLASWGAGFGIKGRLDQLVEGAVGVMRGWPPCLGRSEPGPGWQGGAAQELGQGKCSVKVRVRAVGLSEGRGGCSESTGGAGSGGRGGGEPVLAAGLQRPQGAGLGQRLLPRLPARATGPRRVTAGTSGSQPLF